MAHKRAGFTLVELLVVIAIIGLLMSLLWSALWHAENAARQSATKSSIRAISSAILPRFESYEVRRIARDASGQMDANQQRRDPNTIRRYQLNVLRATAVVENPERWTDLQNVPNALQGNAILRRYLAYIAGVKATNGGTDPTTQFEGAECLYMIIKNSRIEDRDSFLDDIPTGDTDNDGFKEFLDGWSYPITWVRWPYSFQSEMQPSPIPPNVTDAEKYILDNHSNLDPASIDTTPTGLRTLPLIFSAGPDGSYDIRTPRPSGGYAGATYYFLPDGSADVFAVGGSLGAGSFDNITNHDIGTRTR